MDWISKNIPKCLKNFHLCKSGDILVYFQKIHEFSPYMGIFICAKWKA